MMLMVMVMMMMMVMPLYLLLLLLLTAVQLDTEAIILITMTVLFIFLVLNIDSVIVMTIFVNITVIVNPSYHLHHRHGFDHVFSSLFSCVPLKGCHSGMFKRLAGCNLGKRKRRLGIWCLLQSYSFSTCRDWQPDVRAGLPWGSASAVACLSVAGMWQKVAR